LLALLIAFGSPVPQPTKWERIGNQINAAPIAARSHFVNLHWLNRLVRCL
jgi:hypothetical protein